MAKLTFAVEPVASSNCPSSSVSQAIDGAPPSSLSTIAVNVLGWPGRMRASPSLPRLFSIRITRTRGGRSSAWTSIVRRWIACAPLLSVTRNATSCAPAAAKVAVANGSVPSSNWPSASRSQAREAMLPSRSIEPSLRDTGTPTRGRAGPMDIAAPGERFPAAGDTVTCARWIAVVPLSSVTRTRTA